MKTPIIATPQNMEEINFWIEQLPVDHSIIATIAVIKLLNYFNEIIIPSIKIERSN